MPLPRNASSKQPGWTVESEFFRCLRHVDGGRSGPPLVDWPVAKLADREVNAKRPDGDVRAFAFLRQSWQGFAAVRANVGLVDGVSRGRA